MSCLLKQDGKKMDEPLVTICDRVFFRGLGKRRVKRLKRGKGIRGNRG